MVGNRRILSHRYNWIHSPKITCEIPNNLGILGDEPPDLRKLGQERDRRRQTRTLTLQQTSFALEAPTVGHLQIQLVL